MDGRMVRSKFQQRQTKKKVVGARPGSPGSNPFHFTQTSCRFEITKGKTNKKAADVNLPLWLLGSFLVSTSIAEIQQVIT
jgi:hypothetical protein